MTWNAKDRRVKTLEALAEAGPQGLTARELAYQMVGNDVSGVNGWGGPLTLLRQAKEIAALDETRLRHHVYVLLQHVNGRDTWAGYRHRGHCKTCTCDQVAV